jgi:hypothetical protein
MKAVIEQNARSGPAIIRFVEENGVFVSEMTVSSLAVSAEMRMHMGRELIPLSDLLFAARVSVELKSIMAALNDVKP